MALHDQIERYIHSLRYRQVQKHLRPCRLMVDVGCGARYRFLKEFNHLARECWGLDVAVEDGKDGNVFLQRFDVTQNLPFADESVDLITCLAVLEHLEDPAPVFSECCRILEPKGRMIVTTPSRAGIAVHEMLRVLRLVQDVKADEHKNFHMTKKRLAAWTQGAGLRVETLRTFEWGLNIILVAGR